MKKYLLLAILAVISIGAHAEYNRWVFRTLSGEEQSVGVEDLDIIFADGNLVATSGSELVKIPLDSLKSMEFSDTNSSVGSVSSDDVSDVFVYSVDGVSVGIYGSKYDALNDLPVGIYVLKSKNGVTSKVIIRK